MIDRIRLLMAYKDLSSTQFADAIDVPRATVSHLLSERNKPSLDVIVKIISTFRDIDSNWLLLGEGEMKLSLVSDQSATAPAPDAAPETDHPKEVKPIPAAAAVSDVTTNSKEVEQIFILYKDKSFTSYQPS